MCVQVGRPRDQKRNRNRPPRKQGDTPNSNQRFDLRHHLLRSASLVLSRCRSPSELGPTCPAAQRGVRTRAPPGARAHPPQCTVLHLLEWFSRSPECTSLEQRMPTPCQCLSLPPDHPSLPSPCTQDTRTHTPHTPHTHTHIHTPHAHVEHTGGDRARTIISQSPHRAVHGATLPTTSRANPRPNLDRIIPRGASTFYQRP